ncbi:MAG: hypothetical protein OXU22_01530 [Gammaproteobacteria bacterium]|nr:hypothetical protein [Gammaproteobacteria bacterium]
MNLNSLVNNACDKSLFVKPESHINFALDYLQFIKHNLQAVIVSENENHYRFFQYKKDGAYNVTRPINSNLMYDYEQLERAGREFTKIIKDVRNADSRENGEIVKRVVYTAQQCIGTALDALPAKNPIRPER